MSELYERHREILDFIGGYSAENGRPLEVEQLVAVEGVTVEERATCARGPTSSSSG